MKGIKIINRNINEFTQYLKIEDIVNLMCINKRYQENIIQNKKGNGFKPFNIINDSIDLNFELKDYLKRRNVFNQMDYYSFNLFTINKLIKNKQRIPSEIDIYNICSLSNDFISTIKSVASKIKKCNVIIKSAESFRLLNNFENVESIHLYLRATITTVDTISVFNKLKNLKKIFIHATSRLCPSIISSMQFIITPSIEIKYIIDWFDHDLLEEDLNSQKVILMTNNIGTNALRLVTEKKAILLPYISQFYSFPKRFIISNDLINILHQYLPSKLEFFEDSKQLPKRTITIDLSPFEINEIFFNELNMPPNIKFTLPSSALIQMTPSAKVNVTDN